MFSLLVTLLLILLFAPIVISWRTSGRLGDLMRRLSRVEDALDRLTLDRAPRTDASPASDIRHLPRPQARAPPRMTIDAGQVGVGETPVEDSGDIGPPTAPPFPPPPAEPPPGQGFEERLGSRWAVWAGGAALALGGLLLVRYSIEAGLFGPEFRVAAGAVIAAGLIAAGEWMRRNDVAIPVEALPQAHIPSVLTAAGTVIAFATIYAAHALYGFLGPAAAFILLGLTGVITMLAAALHGPWLAGLGLLGAFATPLLIQSDSVNPWPVVLYLSVVAAAAYLLARTRRWRWLASATVIGVALWAWLMAIADQAASPEAPLAAAVFIFIQLALAAIFLAVEPYLGQRDDEATVDRFAAGALTALAAIGCIVILTPQLDFNSRQMFAVLSIALLTATAWRVASVALAGSIAAALSVSTLLAWPDLALPPDIRHTAPWAEGVLRLPENTSRFLAFAALVYADPRRGDGSPIAARTAAHLVCRRALRRRRSGSAAPGAGPRLSASDAVRYFDSVRHRGRGSGDRVRVPLRTFSSHQSGERVAGARHDRGHICRGRAGCLRADADDGAIARLPDRRLGPRSARRGLCRRAPRSLAVAGRRRRARPHRAGARRDRPAHHGRRRRRDADPQLAAHRLRRPGGIVLLRRALAGNAARGFRRQTKRQPRRHFHWSAAVLRSAASDQRGRRAARRREPRRKRAASLCQPRVVVRAGPHEFSRGTIGCSIGRR